MWKYAFALWIFCCSSQYIIISLLHPPVAATIQTWESAYYITHCERAPRHNEKIPTWFRFIPACLEYACMSELISNSKIINTHARACCKIEKFTVSWRSDSMHYILIYDETRCFALHPSHIFWIAHATLLLSVARGWIHFEILIADRHWRLFMVSWRLIVYFMLWQAHASGVGKAARGVAAFGLCIW